MYDRCDGGKKSAPLVVAELSLWASRHLAWSRVCWSFTLADRSRNGGDSVPEQDPAPVGTPEETASSSMSSLEEVSLFTPIHPQNIPPLALSETATSVVEVFIFTTSTILPPVLKISDFEKIEYRADVFNADQPAQAARLTDLDHVNKAGTTALTGRSVADFSSFSVAEDILP